jgi:hypothetical protein
LKRKLFIASVIVVVLSIVFFIFYPMIARGSSPVITFIIGTIVFIIALLTIVVLSLITSLISFGSFATGLEYSWRIIKFPLKFIQDKQQKEFKEFEKAYPQFIKDKLGSLRVTFNDTDSSPIHIDIKNSAFTMSLGKDNTYSDCNFADFKYVLSDPERLIRTDQANLQYRILANPPQLKLDEHSLYALVAPIGSGKTLYLKKLALLAVSDNIASDNITDKGIALPLNVPLRPVYIDLVKFSRSNYINHIKDLEITPHPDGEEVKQALYKFVAKTWHKRHQLVKTLIDSEQHKVLFLLDGLDELPEKKRKNMLKIINALVDRYNSQPAYFVVAKREHQKPDLDGFAYPRLEDFCLNDIYQFAKRWKGKPNIPADNMGNLIYEIENHPRLQALASIPLALIHMAYMQSSPTRNYLFLHRAELYQHITDDLIDRWNKSFIDTENATTTPASLLNREKRKQLLEYLAWDMHNNRTYKYSEIQLMEAIKKGLTVWKIENIQDIDAVYNELIKTNGLIRQEVGSRGYYRFLCFPLQEYLASQFLVDKFDNTFDTFHAVDPFDILKIPERKKNYIENKYNDNDPWWEEVLMLYISRTAKNVDAPIKVATLIEWLAPSSNDPFFTKPIFAGQILAMCKQSDTGCISDDNLINITKQLCTLLKNPPFPTIQEKIGHILGDIGKVELSRNEFSGLSSIYPGINTIPDRKKLSPLFLPLFVNPEPDKVVMADLYNLQTLDVGAVEDVLKRYTAAPGIGASLVCALGVLGKRELAPKLCALLQNGDIAPPIKVSIARVLGILGGWNQVKELITLLAKSESGHDIPELIKWQVVNTLGMLGSNRGYWGNETDVDNKEKDKICLIDELKKCSTNGVYDDYIRWYIAITLCTAFFAIPNGSNGSPNTFTYDFRNFTNRDIANDVVDILQNILEANTSIDNLMDKIIASRRKEDVWLYLCEVIEQLANDPAIIATLTTKVEGKCPEREKCKLGIPCIQAVKCKTDDLQEKILYTKSMIDRRAKTPVILNGNGNV